MVFVTEIGILSASTDMDRIRVGGVPEHFNYPWHLAIERGYFNKHNINVEWTDYKNGTGAMVREISSPNFLTLARSKLYWLEKLMLS